MSEIQENISWYFFSRPQLQQPKQVAGKDYQTFKSRFLDKTRNEWGDRRNFEKVHGKYDLVEIDYATNGDQDGEAGASKAAAGQNGEAKSEEKIPESKMDVRIQVCSFANHSEIYLDTVVCAGFWKDVTIVESDEADL